MKKWDEVKLKVEDSTLKNLGIYMGYEGTVIEKLPEKKVLVWFSNPKNKGEFAFIKVEEDKLEFVADDIYPESIIKEMQEFIKNVDLGQYGRFTDLKIKEYITIQLKEDKLVEQMMIQEINNPFEN